MMTYSAEECHFTDIYSLLYHITTDNVFATDIDKFDNSDSPKDLRYDKYKKVIGKIKNECFGGIVTEFVGLHRKMYSYTVKRKRETTKTKKVKNYVMKKYITQRL